MKFVKFVRFVKYKKSLFRLIKPRDSSCGGKRKINLSACRIPGALARGSLLLFVIVAVFLIVLFTFPPNIFAQVVINEVSPASDPEWVELYNKGTTVISLRGYTIGFGSDSQVKIFCDNNQIEANTYKIVLTSGWLNNTGDKVELKKEDDIIDSIGYGSGYPLAKPTADGSITRRPDGGNTWEVVSASSQKGDLVSFDCPTPTPTPSQAPTSTSPPQQKSTYVVNNAKDDSGKLLSNVKIYIDTNYTGNYAPETYTFCNGCTCGSNKVGCGFGEHSFRLEKSGYEDWNDVETINSGTNYSRDPILNKIENSEQTPTPTNLPTTTPTKTPTPSPTPKTTPSPTSSPRPTGTSVSSENFVLGLRDELTKNDAATQSDVLEKGSKFPLSSILLIFAGLSFFGVAGYAYFASKNTGYNNSNGDSFGKGED